MSSQVLPQQDFFMYIPDLREMTRQLHEGRTGASAKGKVELPVALTDWVKIALDGPMTVYAHVWNKEEEEEVGA